MQNIDDSPHSPLLQMTFNRFCVHGVCVCLCLSPTGRPVVPLSVNYEGCITVYLCVTAPSPSLSAAPEGSRADDIAQAAEQLNQRWVGFCALLADRLAWLAYQAKVHTHTCPLHFCAL